MKNVIDNSLGQQTEHLLRKRKVAELLDCSLRTIDRLVAAGQLKRVRLLSGIRFRLSEVEQLMQGDKA